MKFNFKNTIFISVGVNNPYTNLFGGILWI
jgi:hypothetical protein